MQMLRRATALAVAALLALGGSTTALAQGRSYNDFDTITSHVNLQVPQTLAICNPTADSSVTAANYYLTGTSDPDQPLLLNGDTVPERGIYGSWGVWVPLYEGANTFTVTQSSSSATVTITRAAAGTVATTDSITKAYPTFDSAYSTGDSITYSCIAPAGATVWVQVGQVRIELAQVAAAEPGTPARYRAASTIGGVAKAYNMGKLTYTMQWQGGTKTATTEGNLYLYPAGTDPVVRITDTHTTAYKDKAAKTVSTVVKGGAYDYITDQTDDMYLLGMGSWVPKGSAAPMLEHLTVQNTITKAVHSKTQFGERITFSGAIGPISTSWQTGETLHLELHHTGGLSAVELLDSRLFTAATVTTEGDSTVLELTIAAGQSLWGHTVEYTADSTILYAKYPPVASGNADKPLSGIVVGLDSGHGGSDPGAFGPARLTGPVEKDINYATSIATKKRLESLGATVIMTPGYDKTEKITFSDRAEAMVAGKADFYISLHCNAVAGNGAKPKGTEVYYYYSRSKALADALQKNIATATGRTDRGSKTSTFRVTMNSLTPAVLVEMGFISKADEYDRMCTKEEIFKTANAIGDSLISLVVA